LIWLQRIVRRCAERLRHRRWLQLLALASVVVTTSYIARERLLIAAANMLTIDDAVGPSDYLVVTGGSPDDRPFAAATLFRRGLAPKVVVFEYQPGVAGQLSQTELYERILTLEGVPANAIERAPGLVRSSWEEARSLQRFLAGKPVTRIIIVTSAEHTRRSGWAFRKALAGLPVDVRTAAARHTNFDESNWWHHDEGVLLYLHEFFKFPFYLLQHAAGRL
jgi:uncharacterized SAM-binding protein YcdF (DUF218 family)